MLGKNLSNMSLADLQKAVMGGNPEIEPYQALAAIEKMVKGEKAKIAQTAQQPRPQGMVAQRTLAEAAALRNPYMSAGLGAAPVASPVTSPMGEQAPVGMAGGGMVAFAKGGITPYESGFEPLSDEEQISGLMKRKQALGANNAELLAPLEKYQAKYEGEADKAKSNALSDALIAGGLGALAGTSPFAGANIGQGGLKGLAAYQDAQKAHQAAQDKMLQSQADMAKSRIALEKGDETTAAALQNQARQEAQAAGQFKLQGQYYAGSNAAQMAAANARAAALGGDWKEDVARQKLALARQQLAEKNGPYKIAQTKFLMAKTPEDKAKAQAAMDEIERRFGIGATIPTPPPGAAYAGGNQKIIDFGSIGNNGD